MNNYCKYLPPNRTCDLEIERQVQEVALQEAYELYQEMALEIEYLRRKVHLLEQHCVLHGINIPDLE